MIFKPRPKQAEVLKYQRGKMGVSAVPGSGKTRTLSYLAAKLVAKIKDDQEVLIVTLVNSAVDHFARQVADFVKEAGLLPGFGYRVRTLHGLSNDIVRERPALVGLQEGFQIVDERESDEILEDATLTWVKNNPNSIDRYISQNTNENEYQKIRQNYWPGEVTNICRSFIKQAKDLQLSPEEVRRGLDRFGQPLDLAAMGWEVYAAYQRGLTYRGGVDFQDLMRLALHALELDPQYLERLQYRWAYILEDEAQDSSQLQEDILRKLVGKKGNWVRVGDPNQAIYETFTTADPEQLRQFLREKGVQARELPNSGRSTESIITLANELIAFAGRHPSEAVRERQALQPPLVLPTPKGDPQPNPPDDPSLIYLREERYTPAEEIDAVIRSLQGWLPKNPDKTAAVLVPRNDRGAELVGRLKKEGIEAVELLRSTSSTRETAGALALILRQLSEPLNPMWLAKVYEVWRRDERDDSNEKPRLEAVMHLLRNCRQIEDFVYPYGADWLDVNPEAYTLMQQDEMLRDRILAFRQLIQRWHKAVILPIDQLILTIAQELFITEADLAIAYSLAVILRHDSEIHPEWRLPNFVDELINVAKNKRRVAGLSEDDTGFDPDAHRGKVTVATMHRAKGLEWDRVYLMSVNNYDFPSDEPQDTFIGERWFVRDGLNLEAEALEQLQLLTDPLAFEYDEGAATREARVDYVSERLRLLYVAITRARRELIVTWNTGRDGLRQPAIPLIALQTFWQEYQSVKPVSNKKKKT
jgi:DNA helicase-2/ATP-dependent DNA helicase PcrA